MFWKILKVLILISLSSIESLSYIPMRLVEWSVFSKFGILVGPFSNEKETKKFLLNTIFLQFVQLNHDNNWCSNFLKEKKNYPMKKLVYQLENLQAILEVQHWFHILVFLIWEHCGLQIFQESDRGQTNIQETMENFK